MRALEPAYVDRPLYIKITKPFNDLFSVTMTTGMINAISLPILTVAIFNVGFWLLPALLLILGLDALLIKIMFVSQNAYWSWDKSRYTCAHDVYQEITDGESRALALPLLTAIWNHEAIVGKEVHDTYYKCDCQERADLIKEIKDNQPSVIPDRSDINNAKQILEIRKQDAAIAAEVRKELGV